MFHSIEFDPKCITNIIQSVFKLQQLIFPVNNYVETLESELSANQLDLGTMNPFWGETLDFISIYIYTV